MAVKKWGLALFSLVFLQTGFAGFERFWPFHSKSDSIAQTDDNWNELSTDQQKQLLSRYQNLKDLPTTKSESLENRMNWFAQLPEQEQQKMREAWQQMSTQQRQEMRERMQNATTVDERNSIRQEYIQKFQTTVIKTSN
ncbi:DUF3106 domain-containing protein [Acinetobacter sp. MD2]|uniref:DUF3106 domain-containing protein n=1 Tax=Acinetobacter sp. MD2 TaxID=2600066 RepID=UPI002D1E6D76|nr:DUF3106 domain-containing protein [Acinetobacter sp. MD2]MEB3766258.1 DUF3106 domain-containing protein [Acinetobacter sp. MD2]